MARSAPTEASLGIEATADEIADVPATLTPPDDDIPFSDDTVPEVPAESKPADDKPPEEPKTVDLRALQEARANERELRGRNQLLEQRLNDVLSVMNRQPVPQRQEQQQPVNEVPAEDDLVGRINWLVAQQQRQQQMQEAAGRQRQAAEAGNAMANRVRTMETAFMGTTPDYNDAVEFARKTRDAELQTLYPFSTAEQRMQAIAQDWRNVAEGSLAAGLNPAEQIYKFAQSRGYAKAPQPAAKNIDQQQLAEAQQRHMSLSQAPGGEVTAPLDAKALAKMTDKQFQAWLGQRGNEAKLDEMLGA